MNIFNIGILYVLANIFLIVTDGISLFAFIVHLSLFILFASLLFRYILKFVEKEAVFDEKIRMIQDFQPCECLQQCIKSIIKSFFELIGLQSITRSLVLFIQGYCIVFCIQCCLRCNCMRLLALQIGFGLYLFKNTRPKLWEQYLEMAKQCRTIAQEGRNLKNLIYFMNRIVRQIFRFSKDFEQQIKETRKVKVLIEDEEDRQINIKNKAPYYRFPISFTKQMYFTPINHRGLFIPPFTYNLIGLSHPYFSQEFADAVCTFNDIFVMGFSGIIGAVVGCTLVSQYGKEKKPILLGGFSLQLLFLLGASIYMYNFNPFMIGAVYMGLTIHAGYFKYLYHTSDLPRLLYGFYFKSLPFAVIFSFLSFSLIIVTLQHGKYMDSKIEEMQKLSDTINKRER